jgi:hypothetical protein
LQRLIAQKNGHPLSNFLVTSDATQPSRFSPRAPISGLSPRTFSTFPKENSKIPAILNGRTSCVWWPFATVPRPKKPSSTQQFFDNFGCDATLAVLATRPDKWPFATHFLRFLIKEKAPPKLGGHVGALRGCCYMPSKFQCTFWGHMNLVLNSN